VDLDDCPNLGLPAAPAALLLPAFGPAREGRGRLVAEECTDAFLPLGGGRSVFDIAAAMAGGPRSEVGGVAPREEALLEEEADVEDSSISLNVDCAVQQCYDTYASTMAYPLTSCG